MHGGVKFYRGSAGAARSYVEADRSRADDYYLAEGTGAGRALRSPAAGRGSQRRSGDLDGADLRAVGRRLRRRDRRGRRVGCATTHRALRFVEVVVNGPKSWSLAAALHPEIAAAYDAAQDRAAGEIIGWVAEHATTRVGPRGRQVQVPVEKLEAAVVRHYTSRAGDPHRHLHLQINARVFARGAWRGLHSVGVVDSIEAINGIGHAAVMCDPEFRAALAARGYTLDDETARSRSSRRTPAGSANAPHRSTATSTATKPHGVPSTPARNPDRALRRTWDRRAWADARPDKVVPRRRRRAASPRGTSELRDLGFTPPTSPASAATVPGLQIGGSTATSSPTSCSPGSARSGRRGTPPTSAARSND